MCKGSERPGVSLQGSVLWTSWPKIWDLTCCRCDSLKHLYILTLTRLMIMQMLVYDALWVINRRWTGSCSSSRLMGKSCIFQKQLRCIWVCHRWEFNRTHNSIWGMWIHNTSISVLLLRNSVRSWSLSWCLFNKLRVCIWKHVQSLCVW